MVIAFLTPPEQEGSEGANALFSERAGRMER